MSFMNILSMAELMKVRLAVLAKYDYTAILGVLVFYQEFYKNFDIPDIFSCFYSHCSGNLNS